MTIPNLPTDNLYKFVCFSGLVLIISSIFYYTTFNFETLLKQVELEAKLRQVSRKIANASNEVHIFEGEYKLLGKALDELDKEMFTVESEITSVLKEHANFKQAGLSELGDEYAAKVKWHRTRLDEIKATRAELRVKKEFFSTNLKELELASDENKLLFDQFKIYARKKIFLLLASSIGVVVGLVCFFKGFSLWYYNIQKYQDIMLKKEATKQSS